MQNSFFSCNAAIKLVMSELWELNVREVVSGAPNNLQVNFEN